MFRPKERDEDTRKPDPRYTRREFLETTGKIGLGLGLGAAGLAGCAPAATPTPGALTPTKPAPTPTKVVPTPTTPPKVTVTHWIFPLSGDDTEFFNPLIEEFKKQEPNIDINIEIMSWTNRYERMMSAVAGGRAPDLAYLNGDNYCYFADLGGLVPLDDYLAGTDTLEDLLPGARDAMTWKGSFYVLPILQDASVNWWNLQMMEKAGLDTDPDKLPATWEEYEYAIDRLTVDANGKHPSDPGFDRDNVLQWGTTHGLLVFGTWHMFNPWLWQAGGDFLTPDMSKAALSTDSGREALAELVKMYDNYISPADLGGEYVINRTNFCEERAANVWGSGQGLLKQLRKDYPDLRFHVGPILKHKKRLAHGTVAGYGVFSQSKNVEAAVKWAMFVTNKENAIKWSTFFKYLPARVSAGEPVKELVGDPEYSRFIEETPYTSENLIHPLTNAIMQTIVPELQAAVLHRKSVEQALEDADAGVNRLLATYVSPPTD